MDPADPLAQLPRPYSLALRLRAAGVDDGLIAECVDVDPQALPALLAIATAKLEHVEASERDRTPTEGND